MKHLHGKAKANPNEVQKAALDFAHEVDQKIDALPGIQDVSAGDRKSILKMHIGAERYIQSMAAIAVENPKVLPSHVDPQQMIARMSVASDYSLLRASFERALKLLDGTVLLNTGLSWHDALDIYALAQAQARFDEHLAAQIAPMQHFLSTGPHAPKTPPAAK